MAPNDLLDRYRRDALTTSSPGGLVVMLYDYLVMDLGAAGDAMAAGEVQRSHESLMHAQKIIEMLRGTLRDDLWEGGPQLRRLYDFLWVELVKANLYSDAARVATCLALVRPLQEAWRSVAAAPHGAPLKSPG